MPVTARDDASNFSSGRSVDFDLSQQPHVGAESDRAPRLETRLPVEPASPVMLAALPPTARVRTPTVLGRAREDESRERWVAMLRPVIDVHARLSEDRGC